MSKKQKEHSKCYRKAILHDEDCVRQFLNNCCMCNRLYFINGNIGLCNDCFLLCKLKKEADIDYLCSTCSEPYKSKYPLRSNMCVNCWSSL